MYIITDEVRKQLHKAKSNKAPGPECLKSDLLKIIANHKKCVARLTDGYNRVITEDFCESWSSTCIILIQKGTKINNIILKTNMKFLWGLLRHKLENYRKFRQ